MNRITEDIADLSCRIETHLLPYVERPMRYIGNEINMVRKESATVDLHGILCFPDVYDIGMSHHGSRILYHIGNKLPHCALARCYHPWCDAEQKMREQNIPLYSLEYRMPLSRADWLGFTLQYELSYPGCLNMLDLGGVPLESNARNETHPLVIAGGPCCINPEPMADFIDAFVVGDGEETLVVLCQTMRRVRAARRPRREILELFAAIPGVYVPSLIPVSQSGLFRVPDIPGEKRVRAMKCRELKTELYPDRPLVPLISVVHDRIAVEVMRGCSRGCRFCSAGMLYRPVRERPPGEVAEEIRRGTTRSGIRDAGLLSLSTADYGGLPGLLAGLETLRREDHVRVSLPSTRVDAMTPEAFQSFRDVCGSSSFTIAPEAGSERLRRVINKHFSDESVLRTARILLETNVQTLKLYFMVGLPTENRDDIEAIVHLVEHVARIARSVSRRRVVNISLSPFSPKPHTPFQRVAMERRDALLEKCRYVKESLRRYRNVSVTYRNPELTLLETFLARGDRHTGRCLHRVWELGARLDGWDECFEFARWLKASNDTGVPLEPYIGEIPAGRRVPWSAVSLGITDSFLEREYRAALAEQQTPDCRNGRCAACGICATPHEAMHLVDTAHKKDAARSRQADTSLRSRIASTRHKDFFYRIRYHKTGPIRFLGHRDMMEVIRRSCVAAKIPLSYTAGYHPHPRFSFGPPLPLGVAGEAEWFDVVSTNPCRERFSALADFLPEGLGVDRVVELPYRPASLFSELTASRYRFTPVDCHALPQSVLQRQLESLLSQDSLVITYCRKGNFREKNIRPLIVHAAIVPYGDGMCVDAVLMHNENGSCSPANFIQASFPGSTSVDFFITRVACLVSKSKGNFEMIDHGNE